MSVVALVLMALGQTPATTKAAMSAKPAVLVSTLVTVAGLRPLAMAPSPSGSTFAASMEDNSIRIIDAKTHQTLKTFIGHPQPAYAIAWSGDGAYIASGDESARIFIWDTRTGKKIRTLMGHQRGIQKLSFNYPRTLLMSTGKDDVINVWDVSKGKKVGTVLGHGKNVYGACFNPKTDSFVTGLLSGGGALYNETASGAQLKGYYNMADHVHGAFDAAWSPDGARIVTVGNDSNAVVWDARMFKKIQMLKGHTDFVNHVAFSPNGRLIATGSTDRTVRVWDAKTLQVVQVLDNESSIGSSVCFTADGKYLLTMSVYDTLQVNALTPAQGASATPPAKKPARKVVRRKRG